MSDEQTPVVKRGRGRPRKIQGPAIPTLESKAVPSEAVNNVQKEATPKRVKRVPLGRPRNLLTVLDQDPNWVYRWINDKDSRLDRAKEGGYEPVLGGHTVGDTTLDGGQNPKFGSAVAKQVGGGMWAVLMRIPREYYEEDQKAKMDKLLEAEQQMVRDANQSEGRYGSVIGLNRREVLK